METKTNVMRILDARGVPYAHYFYDASVLRTGSEIAMGLGQNPAQVFKTLVTTDNGHRFYVFMVPVCAELDLKRAAASVKEKSLFMLPQKRLLELTGYVHGGCSPIGMKKQFITVINSSARDFEDIIFSAGRIGFQVRVALSDLIRIVPLLFADICAN